MVTSFSQRKALFFLHNFILFLFINVNTGAINQSSLWGIFVLEQLFLYK